MTPRAAQLLVMNSPVVASNQGWLNGSGAACVQDQTDPIKCERKPKALQPRGSQGLFNTLLIGWLAVDEHEAGRSQARRASSGRASATRHLVPLVNPWVRHAGGEVTTGR